MTFEELLSYTRGLEGRVLRTLAQGAKFRVRVDKHRLVYTPESTGTERPHTFKFANRVFEKFLKTRSFRPGDYRDISKNASYMLALISMCSESMK
ncbi:MAG TPA: hypothetical protein VNE39_07355 [Planctomycetota bacterium]|nr:hypothetical protein [Planctomycetota bacterium]